MIAITASPLFATIQDLGRTGHRAIGVPVSGAADREALLALNALLGNAPRAAAIEAALGGGAYRAERDLDIAFGGAECLVTVDGAAREPWTVHWLRAGAELRLERIVRGRFVYVAVRGGIDVPEVLGSRSTLLSAGFGGLDGRRLKRGDVLRVAPAAIACDVAGVHPPVRDLAAPIPIVRGPQHALLDAGAWRTLTAATFRVSNLSDRSGLRLEGATLEAATPAAVPSEPACVGAIQIPGGGTPIVLLHDGPTVGGYPKIAVVRERAIGALAQRAPGEAVRFTLEE